MKPKQEFAYLLQVLGIFTALAIFKNSLFFVIVGVIALALPFPSGRKKLILCWQNLGKLLGKIVSPVVLSLIYYLAFTPLAYLRRLTGSDELRLKKDLRSNLKEVHEPFTAARFDDLW